MPNNRKLSTTVFFICVSIVNCFRTITHDKFPIMLQLVILFISGKIFDRF